MKKILTAGVLAVSLMFSQAKALDGEIIFRDASFRDLIQPEQSEIRIIQHLHQK